MKLSRVHGRRADLMWNLLVRSRSLEAARAIPRRAADIFGADDVAK